MSHPKDPDETEGPYDITVDDLIQQLQEYKTKHGNMPVTLMWGSGAYEFCHWKGQVSLIYHRPDDEEFAEIVQGDPQYPPEQLLISIY